MPDTIELLHAIGRNATLRYASADVLAPILEQAKASEALRSAVATGDSSLLFEELGQVTNHVPQISNAPGHEEGEEDEPEHDDDDRSPDRGQSAHHRSHKS